MLEIRNDLITDEAGQAVWAAQIAELLEMSLGRLNPEGVQDDA